jgi:putative oxidoreductase
VMIAAALALADLGPGPLSLDAARGRERSGSRWTLSALAAGVIGALGAHLFAASQSVPPQTAAEDSSSNGASAVPEAAPQAA